MLLLSNPTIHNKSSIINPLCLHQYSKQLSSNIPYSRLAAQMIIIRHHRTHLIIWGQVLWMRGRSSRISLDISRLGVGFVFANVTVRRLGPSQVCDPTYTSVYWTMAGSCMSYFYCIDHDYRDPIGYVLQQKTNKIAFLRQLWLNKLCSVTHWLLLFSGSASWIASCICTYHNLGICQSQGFLAPSTPTVMLQILLI